MNPLDRLRDHVGDLCDSYPDNGVTHPPLLAQLYNCGARTLVAAESGGRRTVPGSRPPADLSAVDLLREIHTGAIAWSWCLGGHHRNPVTALRWLPDAAAALGDRDTRLDGAEGLYGAVSRWHRQARVVCGWYEPPTRYPASICTECKEHALVGRPHLDMVWCAACGERFTRYGYAAILKEAQLAQSQP